MSNTDNPKDPAEAGAWSERKTGWTAIVSASVAGSPTVLAMGTSAEMAARWPAVCGAFPDAKMTEFETITRTRDVTPTKETL